MQELSSIGLMPEDWGGDVPMVQISALKGKNINELLETVMLVAELQDLKANPHRSAKGSVIEAGLHKSKGPVVTLIVQNGTLKQGDIVVCGGAFGKVRALFDDGGNRVDEAGPSIPVQVLGLNNVPIAGDEFEVVSSLDIARERAELRAESLRNERISAKAGDGRVTLSSLASAVSAGKLSGLDLHQLNIILKVDLQGSIEAVRQALQVLPQDNVTLKFLLESTGDVSTSDVDLAAASKAIIFGFNVKVPGSVKSYGDNKGVEIRLYRVIYELIDDVRNAMEGLLEPVEERVTIGSAEVRAIFSSGSGRVAGCMINEGKVAKGCGIEVIRRRKVVHVGLLDSLKRVKEVVKEVNAGLECGIGVEDYDEWEEGDTLEFFNTVQKKRTLEEASASMAAAVEGTGRKIQISYFFYLFGVLQKRFIIVITLGDYFNSKRQCFQQLKNIRHFSMEEQHQCDSPLNSSTSAANSHSNYTPLCSQLQRLTMVDPDSSSYNADSNEVGVDCSRENYESTEAISTPKIRDPVANDARSMMGFSLTSPDLVICAGSPDIPQTSYGDSPEFLESKFHQKMDSSIELSFENGIDESQVRDMHKTPTVKFSTTLCQTFKEDLSPEASFELLPPPATENKLKEGSLPDMSNNAGCTDEFIGNDSQMEDYGSLKVTGETKEEGDYHKLLITYEKQKKELQEMRSAMEELKKQNYSKSRECQEACNSLKELQNELMRKSMHVGSLAFAIEGQVKEKSGWFSSLRDLTRKLKIMEMDHIKLSEEARAYKKCLEDMNEMRFTIHSTLNQQVNLHNDLKTKFIEGAKERKELYNKVLELKGNIRVFCRCRPLNTDEVAAGASMAIDFESAKDGELTVKSNGVTRRTFKFDAVLGPQAEQADVFEDTAPFATSVLDGYNVCIFAYGQTGSGKTFTMEGTEDARGVNFRTLQELFHIIGEREKLHRYDVSVSVLEVYNEQIRDLLVSGNQPGAAAKRLEIRQVGEGIHHVPGLVEAHVNNMNEVWEVLQTGSNARAVGSTNANEHSSRSHCIHCVMVKGENLLNGECTRSKLWLVDLAGSERVAKTEVQGERLKETQNINRSLSALGDVVSSLATKSSHIPFRNSKLTHLLQDSLGGDSKTLMFVQISPNENDVSETLCSLNFASRVRGIELGPAKRQLDTSELLKYKQMFEKTKLDVKSKDVQIRKIEETVHGLELKVKERDLKNKNLQDKVKELEAQLLIERKLARQHVDTKIAEQHQQQMKHQQDEQSIAPTRPPFTNRPLASHKVLSEIGSTLGKDQVNPLQPLMEKTNNKPSVPLFHVSDGFIKHLDATEKENNPEMAEQFLVPKKTGRASTCPTYQRIPVNTAPRRNSLIPLPSVPFRVQSPPPALPLAPIVCHADKKVDPDATETDCLPEQTPCSSPKVIRNGGKKLNSILRRSLQKKIQIKSPMPPHMRKGVNVGMEKVRVSIGSRGRMGNRVLLGNARRAGTKESQKPNSHREKERGWNIIGTAARTATKS
ncbi:hypothetical protein ACFX2J_004197 [Malus domestica]